jgi:hypothetical protein
MMTLLYRSFVIAPALTLLSTMTAFSAPVVRQATGPDAASILSAVDTFRSDLGGVNNGVGGSFPTGRREVNWDGVPVEFSTPNNLPPDFFNVNSPRGLVYQTPGEGFQVSANDGTGVPTEFDNINPTYSSLFKTNSPQKLFAVIGSTISEQIFFVPGTTIPATVSGFGAIFTDVDRSFSTRMDYFDVSGKLLYSTIVPGQRNSNETLSFVGVSFNEGERVYKVVITSGNTPLGPDKNETRIRDIVVMDDFIYGEPQPFQLKTSVAR